MGFADNYLQKHAIRNGLVRSNPEEDLHCIVTIPAFKESGLSKCLDSLFRCDKPAYPTEVIVLINSPKDADSSCLSTNEEIYYNACQWVKEHPKENITWHILYEKDLPKKHFGAGLARKLSMDEAVLRFNKVNNPDGIIVSLDADTTVKENYFTAIIEHYRKNTKTNACSIYFEHPLEGAGYQEEVYQAICNYELHLRYYLHALRYTGYPYAYYTVGSAFSVKALTYILEGGMSKRQAGEDFYFIQKVAMLGNFTECNTTCVFPSPRPSDRVPFGTGPDIIKQLEEKLPTYKTYNFSLFKILRKFYTDIELAFLENCISDFVQMQEPVLLEFLAETGFYEALDEIRANSSTPGNFRQRFLRKFNLFWILKFLHYAEEKTFNKTEILDAIKEYVQESGIEIVTDSSFKALKSFRHLEYSVI